MVDFHFKGLQITKVKINCFFLDQVGFNCHHMYHITIHDSFNTQTRLVNPSPHEQNYSILYQLLAGLTQDERSKSPPFEMVLSLNLMFFSFSFSEKYHVNYHDVQTLHYLSQGYPPKETQQQLQNHFEAWKVTGGKV